MRDTPILDLKGDPPRLKRRWATILFALAVGAAIGLLLEGRITLDPAWWFPILYFSIAIHEVGHLAAAKSVGMEAGGIAVGGFLLLKSGSHWVSRFEWRRIFSGGLARPLVKSGRLERRPYVWMIAGGPLATLLVAGVAAAALHFAPENSIWATFLWINLFLFVSTMVPSGSLNQSDIPRLWQLWRDPSAFRSGAALLQIVSEEANGVLPRDWNGASFAVMMASDVPETATYRQMLAFYRDIDLGDESAALGHLEAALAASGQGGAPMRHWCFCEAACSSAILCGNAAAGRIWLDRARSIRPPESASGIDAAIAQTEGRYEEAIGLWDNSLAQIEKRRFDSGLARYGKQKMLEYRAQCRDALAQAKGQSA